MPPALPLPPIDVPVPMVVLRHRRADHPDHFDWLIARDADGVRPLWSWRCAMDPSIAPAVLFVRAMADHRTRYLSYEGPVSGDRGSVERTAAGRLRLISIEPADGVVADLSWSERAPQRVQFDAAPITETQQLDQSGRGAIPIGTEPLHRARLTPRPAGFGLG